MSLTIDTSAPSPDESYLRYLLSHEIRPNTPDEKTKKVIGYWQKDLEKYLRVCSPSKVLSITDKLQIPVAISPDSLRALGGLLEDNPKFSKCKGKFKDQKIRDILDLLKLPPEQLPGIEPTSELSKNHLKFLRSTYKSALKREILKNKGTLPISGDLSIFGAHTIRKIAEEANSPLQRIKLEGPISGDTKAGFLLPPEVPLTFRENSSKVLVNLRETNSTDS